MEPVNGCSNEAVNGICNEDTKKTELYETKAKINVDFNIEEKIIYNAELDVKDERHTIKSEPVDGDEEQEEPDNTHFITFREVDIIYEENKIKSERTDKGKEEYPISIKEENFSDDQLTDYVTRNDISCEKYKIDEAREICKVVKQRRKNRNECLTPLRNQRNNKKLIITIDNIMSSKYITKDSFKQLTASDQSREYNEKYLSTNDPGSCSQSASMKCSSNNSNQDFMLGDVEYLKNYFICDICDRLFNRKPVLIQHIVKHSKLNCELINFKQTKSTIFNCTYCSFRTYHKCDLKIHVNAKHTKSTVFNCSDCNYKTYHKRSLNRHINSKHTKSTVFNCSDCNYKTYHKSDLNIHINSKHTKSIVFNCSDCSYMTYDRSYLNKHIKSKHIKGSVFNCSHCNYKTNYKGDLNRHINSKHTKSTVFHCSCCSYKTYDRSHLNEHMNAKHTKSTFFNCSYCSYKTFQKGTLNRHINAKHTKSTVFNCSDCSFKTYDKSHLNKHINSKHTKSTIFSCSHCSFKTFYKSDLNKHLKVKHS